MTLNPSSPGRYYVDSNENSERVGAVSDGFVHDDGSCVQFDFFPTGDKKLLTRFDLEILCLKST